MALNIPVPGPVPSGFNWMTILGPIGGALISALGALLIWWLNKKRPQHVDVLEIHRASLVDIASPVRSRIAVTFDGNPVKDLSQIALRITNSGADVLKGSCTCFYFSFLNQTSGTRYPPKGGSRTHGNSPLIRLSRDSISQFPSVA
jgi:hypothetical protein